MAAASVPPAGRKGESVVCACAASAPRRSARQRGAALGVGMGGELTVPMRGGQAAGGDPGLAVVKRLKRGGAVRVPRG